MSRKKTTMHRPLAVERIEERNLLTAIVGHSTTMTPDGDLNVQTEVSLSIPEDTPLTENSAPRGVQPSTENANADVLSIVVQPNPTTAPGDNDTLTFTLLTSPSGPF